MADTAVATSRQGQPGGRSWRPLALALTVVAGLFSTAAAALLLVAFLDGPETPYVRGPAFDELQSQFKHSPTDEKLKSGIRRYDAELRQTFFEHRRLAATGGWLLLAGLAATLLGAKWYCHLGPQAVCVPEGPPGGAAEWQRTARRSTAGVAAVAGAAVAAMIGLGLWGGAGRPRTTDEGGALLRTEETWPQFRGPTGVGLVPPGDWPTDWDGPSGRNVLWKCAIPGAGHNSPIVWGDHVFLTSADRMTRWVHCVDARAGRILWSRQVQSPPESAKIDRTLAVSEFTGFAAPTPATDGRRVYATFANADVVCFDFSGRQQWVRNLGEPQSAYGLAASPILYGNLLILQHDQGSEAEEQLSYLVALDAATGGIVWRTPRPVPNSWSSPILIRPDGSSDRRELIACGNSWVMAYDPASGRELWRADALSGDVASTPVFAGGLLFVVSTRQACAIRPGGAGDVTKSNVVWLSEENLPDLVSPIANEKYYLHVQSGGRVTCFAAADGRKLWEHDFEIAMKPSPTLVADTVYLPVEGGNVFLFKLADQFELVGNRPVEPGPGELTASLAFALWAAPRGSGEVAGQGAGGRIYIRSQKYLFCIGKARS